MAGERAIILRHGNGAWQIGTVLQDGEAGWDNENDDLYVGTGAGNILIGGASGLASIDNIQDVTITGVADGEIVQWDAATSQWINRTLDEAGVAANNVVVLWRVVRRGTALTVGDDKDAIFLPLKLNGWNLVSAHACVDTASAAGAVSVAIWNVTDGVDVLSTNITIDAGDKTSYTAAVPAVINAANDDVDTGDEWRCDVDGAGTTVDGLVLILRFELP